jgi:PAS domain S-box-containing protein
MERTPPLAPDAALRLAAIVESSDDAILSKDLNGIVTSWNAGAERLLGYTADEVVGRSIALLVPPDRRAEEALVLERISRGERVTTFDTVRCRKDGTLVEVSVSASPIRDTGGSWWARRRSLAISAIGERRKPRSANHNGA